MTIIIPVNGHTEKEMRNEMVKSFASWGTLLPALNNIFQIKETEEIVGLEIDEDGILTVIKRKK